MHIVVLLNADKIYVWLNIDVIDVWECFEYAYYLCFPHNV